jgi:hypothetical protein
LAPRFGGVGDAVSGLVGALDSNRMIELVTSDGIGMILPRTALALNCRGTDDARETFLRETSGLIGNIFLMGWAGYAVTRLLGDSVNFHNPKGIPGRAWITAPTLDAFGKIYKEELQKAQQSATAPEVGNLSKPIEAARSGFIHRILNGLESDDRELSIEGRLASMEQLEPKDQEKILAEMIKSVPQKIELKACTQLLDQLHPLKNSLHLPQNKARYTTLRQQLRQTFLDAGWGKLSPVGKESLTQAFALKDTQHVGTQLMGTIPFDALARARVDELQEAFIQSSPTLNALLEEHKGSPQGDLEKARLLKLHGFDAQKEFIKQRLARSVTDLRHDAAAFQKKVDKAALLHGLTGTVDLRHRLEGSGEIQLSANRGVMIKELKHFLEQFVDRAAHAAHEAAGPHECWDETRKRIEHNLSAHSTNGGLFQNIIPQAEDGLMTAAIKSKGAYTWIPLGFCIAAAGVFTFYNNYLTMKKHSGRIFFPGEGIPPVEGTQKPGLLNAKALPALGTTGVYRNFGNFPNYPQFRNGQGGIIA